MALTPDPRNVHPDVDEPTRFDISLKIGGKKVANQHRKSAVGSTAPGGKLCLRSFRYSLRGLGALAPLVCMGVRYEF